MTLKYQMTVGELLYHKQFIEINEALKADALDAQHRELQKR